MDTTYSKYGTYVYSVAINGSAEAMVKLAYDYTANTLGLETKKIGTYCSTLIITQKNNQILEL